MEVIVSNHDYIIREALVLCDCGCSILRISHFIKEDYYHFQWYGTSSLGDTPVEENISFKQMADAIYHLQNDFVDIEAPVNFNIDRLFFVQEKNAENNSIYLTIGAEDDKGELNWEVFIAPTERQEFIDMMTKWLEEDYNVNA